MESPNFLFVLVQHAVTLSFAFDERCVCHATVTDVYPESLSLCHIIERLYFRGLFSIPHAWFRIQEPLWPQELAL